ncbi:MAG: hypothetical protein AAF571_12615, partial [Verrucomicrobiota bacterium]
MKILDLKVIYFLMTFGLLLMSGYIQGQDGGDAENECTPDQQEECENDEVPDGDCGCECPPPKWEDSWNETTEADFTLDQSSKTVCRGLANTRTISLKVNKIPGQAEKKQLIACSDEEDQKSSVTVNVTSGTKTVNGNGSEGTRKSFSINYNYTVTVSADGSQIDQGSGVYNGSVTIVNCRSSRGGKGKGGGGGGGVPLPDIDEDPPTDDTDGDGLLNTYEDSYGCLDSAIPDAGEDPDQDGLSNYAESQLGTDPCNIDSDGDGMDDGYEVYWELDPLEDDDAAVDLDQDGWTNLVEYKYNSNPHVDDGEEGTYEIYIDPATGEQGVDPNTGELLWDEIIPPGDTFDDVDEIKWGL